MSRVVCDAGVGIPEAGLPHIFERFHRGSNVVGTIGGTGVGLASVQQLVEEHRGTVRVESVEGCGTTVTMRLPRAGGRALTCRRWGYAPWRDRHAGAG